MKFIKFILFFLFTSFVTPASIYEDAEDKKTSRWGLISSEHVSTVNNIHDSDKKSRVIAFQGDGTKHTYELKTSKTKKHEYWLSWQMKFSEDFVIILLVETNVGRRYLIYTPGVFKGHMQYGLGYTVSNGKWQTHRRNLQKDIAYFDNRVKFVSLKSFVLKGNGKIDNILTEQIKLMKKEKLIKKKKLVKKKSIKKNKQKKVSKKVFKKATNTLPVITLKGAKFLQLNLNEIYVEEGVSAYDKEDGDINVVSMENIDNNQIGRYMVLYMATDSHGNMALDKRYVYVGNMKIEEKKINLDDYENEENDDASRDEKRDFLEQKEQIRVWEKELTLSEKALVNREKNSNKN